MVELAMSKEHPTRCLIVFPLACLFEVVIPFKSRAAKQLRQSLHRRNVTREDLEGSKHAEDPEIIQLQV